MRRIFSVVDERLASEKTVSSFELGSRFLLAEFTPFHSFSSYNVRYCLCHVGICL